MFDDLILLAKGGLTVYHGPVTKVEEYFASFGITVPERVNPPDHFIDILEGIVKPSAGLTVEQLPVRWMLHNGYPVPPDMLHYCDEIASASKGVSTSAQGAPETSSAGNEWKDHQEHSQINFFKPHDLSNRHTPGLIRQYRYFLGRYIICDFFCRQWFPFIISSISNPGIESPILPDNLKCGGGLIYNMNKWLEKLQEGLAISSQLGDLPTSCA